MRDLVQKRLTQSLSKLACEQIRNGTLTTGRSDIITEDLADEAGLALKDRLGEPAGKPPRVCIRVPFTWLTEVV